MKHITSVIDDLSRLAELDGPKRSLRSEKNILQQIHGIRERLPTAILKHYDQRISRGKRGAAKVRNGTCGGCHLSLPIGQLADMRRDDVALQVCGNCSVFLLPEDSKAPGERVAGNFGAGVKAGYPAA